MRLYLIIAGIAISSMWYATWSVLHSALFNDKSIYYRYVRWWAKSLLKIAGIRVVLHGTENLDAKKRYVYVVNHASLFDIPILLGAMPDNIRIMYKKELNRVPFLGWALFFSPFVGVDRSNRREAAAVIDNVVATLKEDASLAVFPEGTRSPDGQLGTFKRGAINIAVRGKTPVVPVTIIGAAEILPRDSRELKGGEVQLIIDAPIDVSGIETSEQEKELVGHLHTMIKQHLDSHL